ncbi:hypothetical protein SRABI35_01524 [Stenotrophomonas lactitubi]|nr:hypothetical protein SRABI35_01524 [Stenotrophomonas lactitubi]
MSEQPHEQMREHHLSRIRGLAMQRDLRGEPTALEVDARVRARATPLACRAPSANGLRPCSTVIATKNPAEAGFLVSSPAGQRPALPANDQFALWIARLLTAIAAS